MKSLTAIPSCKRVLYMICVYIMMETNYLETIYTHLEEEKWHKLIEQYRKKSLLPYYHPPIVKIWHVLCVYVCLYVHSKLTTLNNNDIQCWNESQWFAGHISVCRPSSHLSLLNVWDACVLFARPPCSHSLSVVAARCPATRYGTFHHLREKEKIVWGVLCLMSVRVSCCGDYDGGGILYRRSLTKM